MMDKALRWLGAPAQWIDPRGFRMWLVVAIFVYTIAGFFVAPWLIGRMLPRIVNQSLRRHASIEAVYVNPYVLSVDLRGFRLDDTDGSLLFGFHRLYVNFQATSLFHWAWTFAEIRLDGMKGRLVRHKDGVTNIERLMEGMPSAAKPAKQEKQEKSSPLRLIIGNLNLDGASVEVLDNSLATPFHRLFGPINVSVHNLSTLPDAQGMQQVSIDAGNGIRVGWKGQLALSPLKLTGHVTATGPLPVLAYDYMKDRLAFTLPSGNADIKFDYEIDEQTGRPLSADISNLDVAISGLKVDGESGSTIFDVPMVRLESGSFAWPARKVHVHRFVVAGLSASIVRAKDGALNVLGLIRHEDGANGTVPAAPAAASTNPLADWDLGLDSFEVQNLHVAFDDRTLDPAGNIEVSDANASIRALTNKAGAQMPVEATVTLAGGGTVHVQGDVAALPKAAANLDVSVDKLACSMAQPWLASLMHVRIRRGDVNLRAKVSLPPSGALAVSGGLSFDNLAIADAVRNQPLLGWRSLAIDRYEYQAASHKAEISTVDIKRPYVSFTVNRDHTTNVQALMVKKPATSHATKPPASHAAAPVNVTIGRVRIDNGSADFSDHSLPLPFHAGIKKLEGVISTLSTASSHPASVRLQGQVGNWGLAQIKGNINPLGPTLQTDIGVMFRNIDFPDLSPYTIKFAGRRIASGRLDLNLHYKLDKGKLDGKNNVVIHDFKLGEKVKEPGAMDLPLGLAVALLEDKDGKIDLDVPVTGNVDNPDFKISGVVMKALGHVITGLVASPFRLLGKLVGGGKSEDFGEIDFEPGVADLSPPEREKLAKLAKALALRPVLSLKVPGTVAPDLDALAIRKQRVATAVAALVKAASKASKRELYAEAERHAVESLFTKQFPKESLKALQKQYTVAPKDQPKARPKFDEEAYVAGLRKRLVDAQAVNDADLSTLATTRATAIVNALTQNTGVDPARVVAIAGKSAKPTKTGWVPVKLDVDVAKAVKQDAAKGKP